jgi:hypothetical protein
MTAAFTQVILVQSSKALTEAKCNDHKSKRAMDCLRCQGDQVKSSTSDNPIQVVTRQGQIQMNIPLHLRNDQANI